jgi:hypothetical protein
MATKMTFAGQNGKNHESAIVVSNRYLSIQYLDTDGKNKKSVNGTTERWTAGTEKQLGAHGDHLQ